MSRILPAVAEEVLERAVGCCECCGRGLVMERGQYAFHHRLMLSAGGQDTAVNLMLVRSGFDGGCHNLGRWSIHGQPARSYRCGHLVRRGMDPAGIPVILLGDDPVLSSEVSGT